MKRPAELRTETKGAPRQWIVGSVLASVGSPCWAGTSEPIGLGGLIFVGIVYVIGLVVLSTMGVRSRWALIGAFAWFVSPAALWLNATRVREARNAEVESRAGGDPISAALAYSKFCQSRERQVTLQLPKQSGDRTQNLLVRVDNAFSQGTEKFNAASLAKLLQRFPDQCRKTGLSFIEGLQPNQSGLALRFPACSGAPTTEPAVAPASAQYELILGEASQKDRTPENSRYDLRSASIRIADRQSGQTLATDTMYFFNGMSDGTSCPTAEDQLVELIELVFSSAQ
jgi:hypothetical protein